MKLTIGMASCNNFAETWFTVQSLRLHHDLTDTEILVIDNSADDQLKNFIENWCGNNTRYIRYTEIKGTAAPRNQIFAHALGDWVLCLDAHVFLGPGVVARFREFCEGNLARDLFHGPMLYDNLTGVVDAMDDVWRGNMWGTWREGNCNPADPPYEIPMHGLGLFACRRDAWLWFNDRFTGFGGEEGYIHTKFRQAGHKIILLPFLRWVHKFKTDGVIPYPCLLEDRIRNYLIGFEELGLDTTKLVKHFGQEAVEKIKAQYQRGEAK